MIVSMNPSNPTTHDRDDKSDARDESDKAAPWAISFRLEFMPRIAGTPAPESKPAGHAPSRPHPYSDPMLELVLATGNPHKVKELRAIVASNASWLRVVGLKDLPGHERFHEPPEVGTTFEQNASIKALSYAAQTGRICLADDSGLEIDALDKRPGVISSHYCTQGVETGLSRVDRDLANNNRVLTELQGVPLAGRTARFVCVIAVAEPSLTGEGRILARVRGTFEGRIGLPADEASSPAHVVPRGAHGFGYDPLFLVAPGFARTSAELASDEKNSLSHRANAARLLVPRLRALFPDGASLSGSGM